MITLTMLLFNVPILIFIVILPATLIADQRDTLNPLRTSWGLIHDTSLSVILKVSAKQWGDGRWQVLSLKWNEWMYVLDAILFFSIFGTTPQAVRRYRSATSYILERIGLKKKQQSSMAASDIMFSSDPQTPSRQPVRPVRRGTLSFLDSSIGSGGHSTVSVRSV